ncbi:Metal-dependent hydrolase, endonuclease/exonuclease/phosphatase family [Nonomuraea solani]|uniref:Metal-dependent hydrolase, endonuclease/exonuclease/phosphatase family n=1 Tax=Nonomuraea solani TaxID=1144553 RepID=A0A1H6DIN0_9ACTN|nr:endonuclease/exonuclease/phosphatase family protein [Nonomuraea solani]SEG84693.1 Metal-dependent hydrolase, endonuclease/exonuclease/phosphatase family [Nonomuraea solani]
MTIRVATYNLHGLRDSVPALTRVVTAMRADALCVQEAPGFLRWRARRRALGAATGLRQATQDRAGGTAVYVGKRARVLHAGTHALRAFAGLERRFLAVAVVAAGDARLAVGSLHLDLNGSARAHHAAEAMAIMEDVAAAYEAVIVLGADVNEREDRPAWRFLAGRAADCYAVAPKGDGLTFPSRSPSARIDGVFAEREARVVSCGGADASIADLAAASDHLPVVAELRVEHGAELRVGH